MSELHPLEQLDMLELERKELLRKFTEQTAQTYAAAPNREVAAMLVEALKAEFFVGYEATQEAKKKIEVEELLEMQKMTFTMTPTGTGGGVLEMRGPKDG